MLIFLTPLCFLFFPLFHLSCDLFTSPRSFIFWHSVLLLFLLVLLLLHRFLGPSTSRDLRLWSIMSANIRRHRHSNVWVWVNIWWRFSRTISDYLYTHRCRRWACQYCRSLAGMTWSHLYPPYSRKGYSTHSPPLLTNSFIHPFAHYVSLLYYTLPYLTQPSSPFSCSLIHTVLLTHSFPRSHLSLSLSISLSLPSSLTV